MATAARTHYGVCCNSIGNYGGRQAPRPAAGDRPNLPDFSPLTLDTTCPDRFDPRNSDAPVSERLKSKIMKQRSHSTDEIIIILCDAEIDLA